MAVAPDSSLAKRAIVFMVFSKTLMIYCPSVHRWAIRHIAELD
jgi:hypothetical protein